MLQRIRYPVILLAMLLCLTEFVGYAQERPPWNTADMIRDRMFQAQANTLAAGWNHADVIAASISLIDEAQAQYRAEFQPEYGAFAPAADQAIQDAFAVARSAALAGDAPTLAAAAGRLQTAILWGSKEVALDAVARGEMARSAEWLRLREFRESTKVSTVDNPSAQAINDVQTGAITNDEAAAIIRDDLRDTYFFRLRTALAELAAATDKGFATRAADWAGRAEGYFALLREDFVLKQGRDVAADVAANLAILTEQAIASDWDGIAAMLPTIRDRLGNYQPIALDETTIADRGTLLYTFTDLIYIEYKDGVRNGEITIPIEYYEAQTFHEQAVAIFQELRATLAARDPAASERLTVIFAEIDRIMDDLGESTQVEALVAEALDLIETTLAIEPTAGDDASFTVITTLLDSVVAAAGEGRYADAERTRLEAYAVFEGGPEQRLANRRPLLSRELEGLFWEGIQSEPGLAVLIRQEASPDAIAAVVDAIKPRLAEADTLLAGGVSGLIAALNSLAIIVREGLEAVLIIGAIVGYLRTTGEPKKYAVRVYIGVAAAIGLSLATWWAANTVITITVANRELIEGVTSLIAVAVLFYVTNWLFHKVYVLDWLSFVRQNVGRAISSGSAFGLAALGFTVVYREGFETVLFYQALLFDADPLWVLGGFVLGLAIILVVAYAILHLGQRLPLKPFFTVTGLLLLVLAFSFTGSGIRELQEAGVVSVTLLPIVPENLLLMEILGIYPTVETTLAQGFFLAALVFTFALSFWRGQQARVPSETGSS